MSFKISIEGVTEVIARELKVSSDIQHLDVLNWLDNFEDFAKNNVWSEQQKKSGLKKIITDKKVVELLSEKQYGTIRGEIIKSKYPNNCGMCILTEIENFKQINAFFIGDFVHKMNRKIKEYVILERLGRE